MIRYKSATASAERFAIECNARPTELEEETAIQLCCCCLDFKLYPLFYNALDVSSPKNGVDFVRVKYFL